MNIGISNKATIKLFSLKFCHSTILKQNVNNFSTRHIVSSSVVNKYLSSQFLLYNKHSNKTLFYGSTSAGINLQKRNISNETLNVNDIDKTPKSSTSDATAVEESVQVITSQLPDFVKDISQWKIVDFAQQSLLKVHEFSGLPWWASIILTALAARTIITLPFSIMMMHNTAKLQRVQTEMDDIVKQLKKEANYACSYHGWSESLARKHYNKAVRREYKNLIIRDNCHPAKSYIVLLMQLPLWFSFSFATRNLCFMLPEPNLNAQLTYMELMVGGFGWVKNLTAADQYFILPVSIALTNLAIMEVHALLSPVQFTKFEKVRKIIFRSISLLMIPIAACVPAALNLYWLTSSLFGLVQAFLLVSPRFRRFFKVPITKNELERPYHHFYSQLKSKFT